MLFETFAYPQEESLESTQSLNGTLGAVAALTFQYEFTLLASIRTPVLPKWFPLLLFSLVLTCRSGYHSKFDAI
jgi:hypothetical protein